MHALSYSIKYLKWTANHIGCCWGLYIRVLNFAIMVGLVFQKMKRGHLSDNGPYADSPLANLRFTFKAPPIRNGEVAHTGYLLRCIGPSAGYLVGSLASTTSSAKPCTWRRDRSRHGEDGAAHLAFPAECCASKVLEGENIMRLAETEKCCEVCNHETCGDTDPGTCPRQCRSLIRNF